MTGSLTFSGRVAQQASPAVVECVVGPAIEALLEEQRPCA
jgi:hypothetical protein